ncbi:MAG TPA: TerC family protein [Steroidobacteraceae bacterium]|jgi:predicted tellurium resistance membrane protein TerC|nr:TerC family protein [Steroidobacteraceae bacterium]
MELLADPQSWVSFVTLAFLEIVLGIDNIIFLSVLVERLPKAQRASARMLGLAFAMLTRIALLFSITWLATLRDPLFRALGTDVSGRDLILFAGGLFLVVKAVMEIVGMLKGKVHSRKPSVFNSYVLIILQIGIIDIVFSLDSVFTAVGLAKHIEIMIAAIVVSVLVMMVVSSAISRFIDRYPTIKVLALAFLVLVGAALIAESLELDFPKGYLYFAMAFSVAVEWINIRLRRRIKQ